MKRAFLVAVVIAVIAMGVFTSRAWNRAARQDGRQRYPVTGVVIALEDNAAIRVAHHDIPGFMPAMTMPFTLANPRDRERLSPGDVVQFTFLVGAGRSEAVDVRVTGRKADLAEFGATPVRNSARLRPGDQLPPFSLVNQDGTVLSERDLLGRPTVVTFIFTRCPVPEYCPLIVGRFREVQRAIANNASLADAGLLSVTLDPAYDTPQVLSAYGRAMGADFTRWRFATGSTDQVAVLTRAFAVHTERSGGLIDHTLATALVDAGGRVVEIWRGNTWETREVLDALGRLPQASGS